MFRKVVTLGFYIFLLSISSGCNRQPAQPSFTPGLGEIMTLTQMRHAKLWFAGQGANWPLARYELDELNEGLEDAATFHPTHKDAPLPIPQLITKIMTSPIHQLEEAVGAQDQQRFIKAFDEPVTLATRQPISASTRLLDRLQILTRTSFFNPCIEAAVSKVAITAMPAEANPLWLRGGATLKG